MKVINKADQIHWPKAMKLIKGKLPYICVLYISRVWSEILPRLKWKYAPPTSPWKCWDRKRLRFNQLGRQLVSVHPNGRVLKHDVTVDCPGLFATDGCHMSPVGNALFCNSLQGGIEAFIHTAVKVFES